MSEAEKELLEAAEALDNCIVEAVGGFLMLETGSRKIVELRAGLRAWCPGGGCVVLGCVVVVAIY